MAKLTRKAKQRGIRASWAPIPWGRNEPKKGSGFIYLKKDLDMNPRRVYGSCYLKKTLIVDRVKGLGFILP